MRLIELSDVCVIEIHKERGNRKEIVFQEGRKIKNSSMLMKYTNPQI
jgi:hypothetical protein